jgi:hypothetical protein
MSVKPGHASLAHVTATSTAFARPCVVEAIAVTKAIAVFRDGSSTTAAKLTVRSTAGATVTLPFPSGVAFTDRVHVTITGTSASVDIAYRA